MRVVLRRVRRYMGRQQQVQLSCGGLEAAGDISSQIRSRRARFGRPGVCAGVWWARVAGGGCAVVNARLGAEADLYVQAVAEVAVRSLSE